MAKKVFQLGDETLKGYDISLKRFHFNIFLKVSGGSCFCDSHQAHFGIDNDPSAFAIFPCEDSLRRSEKELWVHPQTHGLRIQDLQKLGRAIRTFS